MSECSTVRLPTGQFSYLDEGSGPPLVFLHALARTPDRLIIEDTAPPTLVTTFPEPPEHPPEPVEFDWDVARQIVGQLNGPKPEWSAGPTKVTTPTLLIAGSANDQALTDVLSKLPDGRLIETPVGHHVQQTAPADYNAAIRSFLSTTRPSPLPTRDGEHPHRSTPPS